MSDIQTSVWTEAAASNITAVPNGFPEGMLPGQLNNCAREVMGAIKREWNRSHPTLTSGGSSPTHTLTPATAISAYVKGQIFAFKLGDLLGAEATLNVSGLGAKKLYVITKSGLAQTASTDGVNTETIFVCYDDTLDSSNGGFIIFAGLPPPSASECIAIGVTSETGVVSTGTGKVTFRMPYSLNLTDVRASLKTAQSSGSILTIDINEGGSTILSTKLTIDNSEKTSTTAATAAVISDSALASGAEITIDVDQIGDGTAAGLKVYLIGKQP